MSTAANTGAAVGTSAGTSTNTDKIQQIEQEIVALLNDTQDLLECFDSAVLPASNTVANANPNTSSMDRAIGTSVDPTSLNNAPIRLQAFLSRTQRIREGLAAEIACVPKSRPYATPYIYDQVATMEYTADVTNFIKERLEDIIVNVPETRNEMQIM